MNILIATIFVTGLLALASQMTLVYATNFSIQPTRKLALQCGALITTGMFVASIVVEVARHL